MQSFRALYLAERKRRNILHAASFAELYVYTYVYTHVHIQVYSRRAGVPRYLMIDSPLKPSGDLHGDDFAPLVHYRSLIQNYSQFCYNITY